MSEGENVERVSGEVVEGAEVKVGAGEAQAEQGLALSPSQKTALSALECGYTFVRAAEAAGVSRMTVYRWTRLHPAFRAAYSAWEQESHASARARLLAAADRAVSNVIKYLDVEPKFALKVVKELGLFRPQPAAEIDPQRVRQQIELEVLEQERQMNRRLDRVTRPPGRRGRPRLPLNPPAAAAGPQGKIGDAADVT
jgi:hypothetical protein